MSPGVEREAWLEGIPPELRGALGPEARAEFAALLERAAAEGGAFGLAPDRFAAFAFGRVQGDDVAAGLRALRAGDLSLCCACLEGLPPALEAFEQLFVRTVEPALTRLGLGAADRQDIAQQLRIKLLVGVDGRGPALGRYAGRGSLAGWVRANAVRAAHDARRGGAAAREVDWVDWAAVADDPEIARLKHAYRDQFARAAAEALAGLSPRARLLLKQHLLDGVTVAGLAALYGVHGATVYRWLDAARDELIADTRRRLAAALGLDGREVERLMGLLQSQLDVSVRRLLESD